MRSNPGLLEVDHLPGADQVPHGKAAGRLEPDVRLRMGLALEQARELLGGQDLLRRTGSTRSTRPSRSMGVGGEGTVFRLPSEAPIPPSGGRGALTVGPHILIPGGARRMRSTMGSDSAELTPAAAPRAHREAAIEELARALGIGPSSAQLLVAAGYRSPGAGPGALRRRPPPRRGRPGGDRAHRAEASTGAGARAPGGPGPPNPRS